MFYLTPHLMCLYSVLFSRFLLATPVFLVLWTFIALYFVEDLLSDLLFLCPNQLKLHSIIYISLNSPTLIFPLIHFLLVFSIVLDKFYCKRSKMKRVVWSSMSGLYSSYILIPIYMCVGSFCKRELMWGHSSISDYP